jgi:DNA-binding CsgD family transcriptional regulator/GAF domain-containing protein
MAQTNGDKTKAGTEAARTTERERLHAVRRYDILDTPPDGAFDRITALAADYFDVPVSIVSVVDEDRIWFKSRVGVEDLEEVARDPGLCASAILHDDVWVIENAAADPEALANPLVAGEAGFRFYAGAPLKTADGHKLGTLCILDRKPRELNDEQKARLQDLAALVMDELELRIAAREVAAKERQEREEAEAAAAVFVRSLNPMLIVDDDHRIQDANCTASLLCRISQEQLRNLRLEDITPAERRSEVELLFERLRREGSLSGRYTLQLPDQTMLEVEYSATSDIRPGHHLFILMVWSEGNGKDSGGGAAAPGVTAARPTDTPVLTKREREVMALLAMGDTGEQIARQLFISPDTVRTHVQNARRKLGASTRAHAIALALQAGEISVQLDAPTATIDLPLFEDDAQGTSERTSGD